MKYASVCDGIGAAHVAWQPLGWKCVWTSEIDAFPSAVVEQRWGFQNRGDMTKFKEWTDGEAIELLVGGTPCQSFSVAGLRKGLLDPRGGLMLTFLGIAQRYRPRWVVWENVPGVLSSGQGRDFGSFLGALAELGYGWAYRVLDAQWFGVAQRRRRVFVVGCLGDMRCAAQVLFESEGVCRDHPPSREKGQRVTGSLTARSGRNGGSANGDIDSGRVIAYTSDGKLADPISAHEGSTYTHEGTTFRLHNCVSQPYTKAKRAQSNKDDETWVPGEVAPTFNVFDSGDTRATTVVAFANRTRDGIKVPEVMKDGVTPALTNPGDGGRSDAVNVVVPQPVAMVNMQGSKGNAVAQADGPSFTLNAMHGHDVHAIAASNVAYTTKLHNTTSNNAGKIFEERTTCLDANSPPPVLLTRMAVRRLTPRECERLQGFPDDYTAITYRNKPAADGPRYKALGNSMAVPVMRWIGERIAKVESQGGA